MKLPSAITVQSYLSYYLAYQGVCGFYYCRQSQQLKRSKCLIVYCVIYYGFLLSYMPIIVYETLKRTSDAFEDTNELTLTNVLYSGSIATTVLCLVINWQYVWNIPPRIQQLFILERTYFQKRQHILTDELLMTQLRKLFLHEIIYIAAPYLMLFYEAYCFGLNSFFDCFSLYLRCSLCSMNGLTLLIFLQLWKICYLWIKLNSYLEHLLINTKENLEHNLMHLQRVHYLYEELIIIASWLYQNSKSFILYLMMRGTCNTTIDIYYLLKQLFRNQTDTKRNIVLNSYFVIYFMYGFYLINNLAEKMQCLFENTRKILRETEVTNKSCQKFCNLFLLHLSWRKIEATVFHTISINRASTFQVIYNVLLYSLIVLQFVYFDF